MESLTFVSQLSVDDWREYRGAIAVRFNRDLPKARGGRLVDQGLQLNDSIPDDGGTFLGEIRYDCTEKGIVTRRLELTAETGWPRVRDITRGPRHLYLWLDRFEAIVLPLRDLNQLHCADDAERRFREWMAAAGSASAAKELSSLITPDEMAPQPGRWSSFLARAWLLKPPGPAPLTSVVPPIIFLSVLSLIAWMFIDWRASVPAPQWSLYGIPLFAWYVLGIGTFAALIRWRCDPPPRFEHALLLTMGLAPFVLCFIALPDEDDHATLVLTARFLIAVALVVFLGRGLRALTGTAQRFAVLNGAVFLAAFFLLSDQLNVIPSFWTVADANAPVQEAADAGSEALLFVQQARIDGALAAVRPTANGVPAAYFLGFAGVGDQKVFAQEIALAKRVLGERFAIDARAVSLINDQRDLDRAPLATVTGLRYALRGLGRKMNRDNDVLFLAISSHGSKDPAIAVANGGLPLNDLTDDELADSLRASGIKWRVLIISACYAGGFIDALKDPQTIVITAAARDRTSFGCSNDRNLTYFGEAFYRDALPTARSLREAFEVAKAAIEKREIEEREKPSDPQAYFGSKVEAKVAAMSAAQH